ncbi:MAG: helix-turn-helix transcriptional regulator [Bacteroidota bacterium]
MSVHIGKRIEARLIELGMSKAEFGRRINTSRQNVSIILKRTSINTDLLEKVCQVLDYDFYEHFKRPDNGKSFRRRGKVFFLVEVDQDDMPDSFYDKYGTE